MNLENLIDEEMKKDLMRVLEGDDKVQAVIMVQQKFKKGLRESKDYVDQLLSKMSELKN